MDSYRLRYDEENGTLEREGIVTPKGSRVVMHADGLVVCKIAGGSYTSGQNMRGYGAAEFVVCEEVYSDRQRRLYDEATHPNRMWLRTGDVDGWINVRERVRWPVRS